jgi:hypothetical protein
MGFGEAEVRGVESMSSQVVLIQGIDSRRLVAFYPERIDHCVELIKESRALGWTVCLLIGRGRLEAVLRGRYIRVMSAIAAVHV